MIIFVPPILTMRTLAAITLAICSMNFHRTFAQEESMLEKKLYLGIKGCAINQPSLPRLFLTSASFWRSGNITNVTGSGKCNKEGNPDLWVSAIDIKYDRKETAFEVMDSIMVSIKNPAYFHENFTLFCKPGKIFCLKYKDATIRIVSFNSCANSKLFESMKAYYKATKEYDRILVVRCGTSIPDMVFINQMSK